MQHRGLSDQRLGRMHDTMSRHVEDGHVAGMVTLISHGQRVHADSIGKRSLGGEPMTRDTIFRIASMTKPVVAVAAMILVEECRLRLDDPVEGFLPELADMEVLRSIESDIGDTVPAERPITLRDLLTMRMGTGTILAAPDTYPIQTAMDENELTPGWELPPLPPDEYMKRLGDLPLVYQPGEAWMYEMSSDVLGVLVSRVTGGSLGSFLQDRIFSPLGMNDTGFTVPDSKLERLADCYRVGTDGGLEVFDAAAESAWSGTPVFESGAGGLVSTVDDYLAFCRMMLGKGKLGDERILSRPSVELMTRDHLTDAQKAGGRVLLGAGTGWGFGMSVVTERTGLATPGTFGWDGGYTTSGHTDPEEGMIAILMTQLVAGNNVSGQVYGDFWTSVYQAVE